MSKMGLHDPFKFLNISYGQKKGWESNCQFDFRPLKVKNRPNFLVCRWRATYGWKAFNKGYNFASGLISIGGLHTKLWLSKLRKSQFREFRDSHLGVLGQNVIWVMAPWPGSKYIIRGKVVASPKSEPWWVLWIRVCPWLIHARPWFILAPKVLQLCTNQLVVWFIQFRVSNWIVCQSS